MLMWHSAMSLIISCWDKSSDKPSLARTRRHLKSCTGATCSSGEQPNLLSAQRLDAACSVRAA